MVSLHEKLLEDGHVVSRRFSKDSSEEVAKGLARVIVDYSEHKEDFNILLASKAVEGNSEYPNFLPVNDCFLVYSKGRGVNKAFVIIPSVDGRLFIP